MKQLFWKEWHELRLLPLAAALCMVLLMFGEHVVMGGPQRPFGLNDAIPAFMAACVLVGVASGAGLISQEVGSGGLVL